MNHLHASLLHAVKCSLLEFTAVSVVSVVNVTLGSGEGEPLESFGIIFLQA